MADDVAKFLEALAASLREGTFVKLTLGNYKGEEVGLQKVLARPIATKRESVVSFTYRYKTRDVVKNHDASRAADVVSEMLSSGFRAAHLATVANTIELRISKKGGAHLTATSASRSPTVATHDRQKQRYIDPASPWLHRLGISTAEGVVRASQQDKWRQVNKFVEIVAVLIDNSRLDDRRALTIVDMGSGKGYLTFALYEHLSARGLAISLTGVEARKELVDLCNKIAADNAFTGLRFAAGTIATFDASSIDILIALHACDTATDDALYRGILAEAELIIAAPCCHQEPRAQLKSPETVKDILKHGVMAERTAEMLTDGLRALLLEREGYATKVFEFVPIEHTPKNNMIAGTRTHRPSDAARYARQISEIKTAFGIEQQRLESLLANKKAR